MAKQSAGLMQQINALAVPYGQLALWSLGQAGFVIKGGQTLACIDPYLSDPTPLGFGRRAAIVLNPADLPNLDVVFATHEHLDHADPRTLGPMLAAAEGATLVTSVQGMAIASGVGVAESRIVTPSLGQRHELGWLAFTAIPAAHYSYEVDPIGRSRWMGFLIECNGVTLYHAGDTILFPELLAALADVRADIALLPINGRDFMRDQHNIIGNLWPHEAVDLALRVQAKVLIGIHNDMFAGNRVAPGLLFDAVERLAPFQRCHTLQAGEAYMYV
ncbi:MAG: MBL fold metallo-hydrolase [Roseiflexaceae bacterium]|nr:MBL fold metallo-hydrolase [Roseiflexaceae bacterium]